MRFKTKSSIEVGLLLSEEEAKWLMAYCQNYYGGDETTEPEESRRNRETLFEGLKNALKGSSNENFGSGHRDHDRMGL